GPPPPPDAVLGAWPRRTQGAARRAAGRRQRGVQWRSRGKPNGQRRQHFRGRLALGLGLVAGLLLRDPIVRGVIADVETQGDGEYDEDGDSSDPGQPGRHDETGTDQGFSDGRGWPKGLRIVYRPAVSGSVWARRATASMQYTNIRWPGSPSVIASRCASGSVQRRSAATCHLIRAACFGVNRASILATVHPARSSGSLRSIAGL